MVPHKSPSIFRKLMPTRLWKFDTSNKQLYLTFDDGPIPGLTDWILDVLKEYNALATFFCVGENIIKYPDLFKRIIEEGHSVGNHTQHHLNGWKTELEVYLKDVVDCDESMKKNEISTHLFRPPYGRLNWKQRKELEDKTIVMWDVLSKDYLMTLDKEIVLSETIAATEPGSIIVFHDNYKAEKNMKYALPKFIEHFKNLGYHFGRIQ